MRVTFAAIASLMLAACFSGYSEESPRSGELRVRRATFVDTAVLTGELEAARGATLAVPTLPQWETSIKWLAIEGTEVRRGDRVVELDNSTFASALDSKRQEELQVRQEIQQKEAEWKADLEQKQLDFDSRRSEREKAKIDAAVPRDLLSEREYSDRQMRLQRTSVELDKARDNLAAQRKGIESDRRNLQLRLDKAQREVRLSEEAIESLILRAPRDGIVVVRDLPWEGRKLQAGDNVWVGFPIAMIPELSSLQVTARLADVDDGRIAPGMPATIVLDGYPGSTFSGHVASISAVAQESGRLSMRRSFRVVVTLDRIDAARMRPGLSARVEVTRTRTANALVVPRAAVDLSGTAPRARLSSGRLVPVTLGRCNAQECVVREGLKEGDVVGRADEVTNG